MLAAPTDAPTLGSSATSRDDSGAPGGSALDLDGPADAAPEHTPEAVASAALATLAALAASLERAGGHVGALTDSSTTVLCLTSVMHTQLANVGARAADVSAAAARVAEQSRSASAAVAEIRALVDVARTTVAALADHARDIEHVSATLNRLALEARFVGLNAAVEAAHAGDAGRGFAVVADKVRELADGAAGAAAQIVERLAGIRDNALHSAAVMNDVGSAVSTIDGFTAGVADAAAAQESDTAEITGSLVEVTGEVDQIVRAVEHITEIGMALGDSTAESLARALGAAS
jgi:methyl-accepting chemotaxis protein